MWNKIKNALHDFLIWFVVLVIIGFSIFIVNSYLSHQKSLFPNANVYGKSISGAESIETPTDTKSSLPSDRDAWGQTGDFFGGILNPLISLGALILLFFNIRLTKNELKETRELLEIQKFEGTFFALLDQHSNILKNINLNDHRFDYGFDPSSKIKDLDAGLNESLEYILNYNGKVLLGYFSVVFNVLCFIENHFNRKNKKEKNIQEKEFYVSLFLGFIPDNLLEILIIYFFQPENKIKSKIKKDLFFSLISDVFNDRFYISEESSELKLAAYFLRREVTKEHFLLSFCKDILSDDEMLKMDHKFEKNSDPSEHEEYEGGSYSPEDYNDFEWQRSPDEYFREYGIFVAKFLVFQKIKKILPTPST